MKSLRKDTTAVLLAVIAADQAASDRALDAVRRARNLRTNHVFHRDPDLSRAALRAAETLENEAVWLADSIIARAPIRLGAA